MSIVCCPLCWKQRALPLSGSVTALLSQVQHAHNRFSLLLLLLHVLRCTDFLPDVDVDLTALYRALYAKLNITLPVPDLPTVNLRLLLRGINLNLGDLLPRFGFDVPHIIIAGMSPAPNLLTFLPNLDVNITDIFGGVNITLPSIPAVSIRLSTLLAGLSPPPSLPDLFRPITVDMDALLRNLRINMPNLPPLPPLPKIKIGLPDFLPLIPGISPPLSLSGLLPKVTVRLPALPSVNVDLRRFLKKWSVTIIELLQVRRHRSSGSGSGYFEWVFAHGLQLQRKQFLATPPSLSCCR